MLPGDSFIAGRTSDASTVQGKRLLLLGGITPAESFAGDTFPSLPHPRQAAILNERCLRSPQKCTLELSPPSAARGRNHPGFAVADAANLMTMTRPTTGTAFLVLPSARSEDPEPEKRSPPAPGTSSGLHHIVTKSGPSRTQADLATILGTSGIRLSHLPSMPGYPQPDVDSLRTPLLVFTSHSHKGGEDYRLPPRIIDHRSVTPTPDTSTSPNGKGYNPRSDSAIAPPKLLAAGSKPPLTLSPIVTSPAQVTTKNALANLSSPSSPSSSSQALRSAPGPTETDMTGVEKSTSPSSASRPLSAREAMLCPTHIKTAEGKVLLPRDRVWYLGFVKTWETFHPNALSFWGDRTLISALGEIDSQQIRVPRTNNLDRTNDQEDLTSQVQSDLLDVVLRVANQILLTRAWRGIGRPVRFSLLDAQDEDTDYDEYSFKPSFVVGANLRSGDRLERMLGHVEYLDGQKGALSRAVKTRATNTWGSLRCVLGQSSTKD